MRTTSLAGFALLAVACGGGTSSTDGGADAAAADMSRPGAMTSRYVIDEVTLPQKKSDFAIDIDGDGNPDNEFGAVVQTLHGQGLDLQSSENDTIASGVGLNLISISALSLADDPAATVTMYTAKNQNPPDFSGVGSFVVDPGVQKATLPGAIQASVFSSASPLQSTAPPTINVAIQIYTGTSVIMPLVGAQAQFDTATVTPDGGVSTRGLTKGQLHGAMRESDINSILMPALAKVADMLVKKMPCDANCMQASQFFDTNKDGMVTTQEVQDNAIVQALLAPDVQLYDANGNWHPTTPPQNKDSVSVGLGFSAVSAMFTE